MAAEVRDKRLAISAVRKASRLLSTARPKLRSFAQQADRLAAAYGFTISSDALTDFVSKNTKPARQDELVAAMLRFLETEYPAELERAYTEAALEAVGADDPIVNALHHFLLPDRPLATDRLQRLQGDYAAYIPFFDDPAQIMVMALICGPDDRLERFEITMTYTAENGRTRTDRVEGSIIPYEESVLFVGRIIGNVAPYIFILTNFPIDPALGKYESGAGAVLVGSRAAIPTASPMAIHRAEQAPEPKVLTAEQAASGIREWRAVSRVMRRGYVDWR